MQGAGRVFSGGEKSVSKGPVAEENLTFKTPKGGKWYNTSEEWQEEVWPGRTL